MKIDLNKRFFHEKGFTLLELMVAIAIIAILSTVVIAMTSKARARGRDGQRYSDIRQINNAIQLYVTSNGHAPYLDGCGWPASSGCAVTDQYTWFPPSDWDELATKLNPYIKKLPVDPCRGNCNIPLNSEYYFYEYSAPNMYRNNDQYQIFAGRLETVSQPFGFSTTSTGGFTSQ